MGVKAEWLPSFDRIRYKDGEMYRVTKSRGKLTLDEITDALRDAGVEGYAVVLLRIGDVYDGWNDDVPKGDIVDVPVLDEGSPCPVCNRLVPLIRYCPECGKRINTTEVSDQ